VFYLSVAPKFFAEAIQQLGAAGMLSDPQDSPGSENPLVGTWLSRMLEPSGAEVCKEEQVYRIDHYLGETVQNI